jgi:predicted PurR-regulated permease PerM
MSVEAGQDATTRGVQIVAGVAKQLGADIGTGPAAVEAARQPPRAQDDDDMPLPSDPKTIFLAGLFFLALLTALYAASAIMLPIALAIILRLLLQPFVRLLSRLHVPRGIGAALAIGLLMVGIAGLVSGIAGPGASWAAKLPDAIPKVEGKLAFLQRPLGTVQWVMKELQGIVSYSGGGGIGDGAGSPPPPAAGLPPAPAPRFDLLGGLGVLFSGTAAIATGLFTTLLVLFYLLVCGETFLRRIVEILPTFGNKRQAVETSLHIEQDVSVYLVTVTLINVTVGLCTLGIMWACGVANPLLWGVLALVLNFVPIMGAAVGIVIFLMASVVSLGVTWWALLPVGLYFVVHLIEGELVTPLLVARRFTVNPVAVILALIFWSWMWGVPGAILAMPMLAVTKIVCDDLRPFRAFGHLLEG